MKNRKTFRTAQSWFMGLLDICATNMTSADFFTHKEKTSPVLVDFISMKYNINNVYKKAFEKLPEESYKKIKQLIEAEGRDFKTAHGRELTFAEISVRLITLAEEQRKELAESLGFGDNFQKTKPKKVVPKKKTV